MIPPPSAPSAVRIQQALAAFKARDRDAAASILAALAAEEPPLGPTWGSVSRLALTLGEISLALTAARRHAALDRRDLAARLNHGQMLAQNGRAAEAVRVANRIVADHPGSAAYHFLASCKAASGQVAGAVADFRRAVAVSPDPFAVTQSWLSIADARTFTDPDDEDLKAMEALLARWPNGHGRPEGRAALLYALGKAYDDLKRHDAAFRAYAEGARLVAAVRPAQEEGDGFVDAVVSGFTREALARLPRSTIDSRRPIFVLGLPRSGTTLVEQILVSHSRVVDGAEINLFQAAAMPVGGADPKAVAAFAAARPDGFDAIGRAYLHMLDDRFGPKGHVVDKTLNHSRYLGLIHQVLPEARIVWLRREPGAVAWSAFKTWFAQGMNWTWSLEAIGRHMRREDRLHAHWTSVMGDAILTVPYEALVADPGPWIGRILEHVGLPFEPGVEAFHKTNRAVTTASFAQVRRPIYTSSMEAWRRHERALRPFFEAYGGG
jgi:tetratricopeptide (TPR) repeat protein